MFLYSIHISFLLEFLPLGILSPLLRGHPGSRNSSGTVQTSFGSMYRSCAVPPFLARRACPGPPLPAWCWAYGYPCPYKCRHWRHWYGAFEAFVFPSSFCFWRFALTAHRPFGASAHSMELSTLSPLSPTWAENSQRARTVSKRGSSQLKKTDLAILIPTSEHW
jgi:hypothetical protein